MGSAAIGFSAKITTFAKKFTGSEKNSLDLNFCVEVRSRSFA